MLFCKALKERKNPPKTACFRRMLAFHAFFAGTTILAKKSNRVNTMVSQETIAGRIYFCFLVSEKSEKP